MIRSLILIGFTILAVGFLVAFVVAQTSIPQIIPLK